MQNISPPAPFTCIDLFAGIGGFRLALEALGGSCIRFSEINRDAIETYCTNFGESEDRNLGDITKVTCLPPHDILTAGVPCQSWSIAGRNLGFDDDRGQLWNDTLFLLHQSRPKAFIFENVKGLADPRNQQALQYILQRIRDAGYFAKHFVLTSSDYGVPQDRVRVYIIGFLHEESLQKFRLPPPRPCHLKLRDVISVPSSGLSQQECGSRDLFGCVLQEKRRHRKTQGMNDFFSFNDIRNGPTTIHSWDLKPTTERQKAICLLILQNRRKSAYGRLDGNPLSLTHLQQLDSSIKKIELDVLVDMGILKTVLYTFAICSKQMVLNDVESMIFNNIAAGRNSLDALRECRDLLLAKFSLNKAVAAMVERGVLDCVEIRYEFRYTKISTGIDGVNRIFLPQSEAFPTLVASDTNDFIALKDIKADTVEEYKKIFLQEIYSKNLYRKISKPESCQIQGFPADFKLPDNRSRWMRLLGNSVSVPVVHALAAAIVETGCFSQSKKLSEQFSVGGNSMHSIERTPLLI